MIMRIIPDGMVIIFKCTIPGINRVIQVHNIIFHGSHQGGQFKSGSGFAAFAYRIILYFAIITVGIFSKVNHCFHFTRFHFHHHHSSMIRILGYQLAHQGILGHILQIDIDRCNDIFTVPGFNFIALIHRHPYIAVQALHKANALGSGQVIVICSLNADQVSVFIF